MKKGVQADKKVKEMKNAKMPKWKAESTAFRSMLQQERNQGPMTAAQQNEYKKAQEALKEASGYVKCPTCGRSFNEKAGQRHISFCAEQAKKTAMKRR
jgi:membrane protease subunit (stomatin/prohibitin family)